MQIIFIQEFTELLQVTKFFSHFILLENVHAASRMFFYFWGRIAQIFISLVEFNVNRRLKILIIVQDLKRFGPPTKNDLSKKVDTVIQLFWLRLT